MQCLGGGCGVNVGGLGRRYENRQFLWCGFERRRYLDRECVVVWVWSWAVPGAERP